jgi:putative ABC transport system ATP-binding protein
VTLPCRFSEARRKKITGKDSSPSEEALRLLDYLGISGQEMWRKPVTELSVGQQQRVAAARALMGSPELIIADEPTSSLDAGVQETFIRLLFQECSEQGSTLVFVSHDEGFGKLFDRNMQLQKITDSESYIAREGGTL